MAKEAVTIQFAMNSTAPVVPFACHITSKSRRKKSLKHAPLPIPFPRVSSSEANRIQGVFTGTSVEVVDQGFILELYEHGCYGKGNKSRGGPTSRQDEVLVLSLEEASFLSYSLDVLNIRNLESEQLSWSAFLSSARAVNPNFVTHMAGYLYLKSLNWVIKSGIKFGGDYLIYKSGPNYCHASFLVIIAMPEHSFTSKNIKGLQRIAETSDKDVLLLNVIQPEDFIPHSPTDFQNVRVTETIIRRFNYPAFVQNQQTVTNK